MNNDLQKAKELLKEGYTFSAVMGDDKKTSNERGVKPLLSLLDEGAVLSGYSAADKVVGKGAAHLYVLLDVRCVYAHTVSVPAYEFLKNHGIEVEYSNLTDGIRNRKNTGMCPVESATLDIDDSEYALEVIRKTLKAL